MHTLLLSYGNNFNFQIVLIINNFNPQVQYFVNSLHW